MQQIESALPVATKESPITITATLDIAVSNLQPYLDAFAQAERDCLGGL